MRTTVTFAPDVATAVDDLRRERGIGMSDAVNELIRRGLAAGSSRSEFRQRTYDLGMRVDVTNVAEAISLLDGPDTV